MCLLLYSLMVYNLYSQLLSSQTVKSFPAEAASPRLHSTAATIQLPPSALSFVHFPDLYATLAVDPSNDTHFDANLRGSYKRLSVLWHPDKVALHVGVHAAEAAKVWRAVQFAYKILKDPETRREYDESGGSLHGLHTIDSGDILSGFDSVWEEGREACMRDYGLFESRRHECEEEPWWMHPLKLVGF